MRFEFVLMAAGAILLAGCGGRVANPVQALRPSDTALTCSHISAEMKSNQQYAAELKRADSNKAANNVGALLASGPLFLDASDTERQEILAIQARNKRLVKLGHAKNCKKLPKLLDFK